MKIYICEICGYVHYGDELPEVCPQCGATKEVFKFKEEIEDNK